MKTKKAISLVILTIFILIFGCKEPSKRDLLLGKWEFVASYNAKNNKQIKKAEKDDPLFAVITPSKIKLINKNETDVNETYFWNLKGDSLIVKKENKKKSYSVFIRKLNNKSLLLEFQFFGNLRVEFKKVK